MKSLTEHIEHVKTKPHHVRKRVAFGVAGGVTGLIGLVWLAGSLSFGLFAIKDHNFAESTGAVPVITTSNAPDTSKLAGAASAFTTGSQTAHIEIVDTTPSVTPNKKAEQTVIPF